MGKKRRILAKPQKFGEKFTSHPRLAVQSNQEQIEELPLAVEEVSAPILGAVEEEVVSAPKAKATRKKVASKRKPATAKAKKTTSKK